MLYLKVDQISLKMGEHERNREELSGILTVRAHIFSEMFVYFNIEEFVCNVPQFVSLCTKGKKIFFTQNITKQPTFRYLLFFFSASQVAIIGTRKKFNILRFNPESESDSFFFAKFAFGTSNKGQ